MSSIPIVTSSHLLMTMGIEKADVFLTVKQALKVPWMSCLSSIGK